MTEPVWALSRRLRAQARRNPARLVLPEGNDERVLRAAAALRDQGLAQVIVLGPPATVHATARAAGVDLTGLTLLDPATDPRRTGFAQRYLAVRQSAGDTPELAYELVADPIYFGVMLLDSGQADGMVAGASTPTGATIEPALRMRRLVPGMGPIASCFLMELPPGRLPGDIGDVLVFADCALNPLPSAAMLARIAMVAAEAATQLCALEPRVALLSSSTKGSATSDRITVVREALTQLLKRAPRLRVDGELQVDAALVESVGRLKAPDSLVAGRANVLVFPDLETGNIAYKLVERLAGAHAIGPLFFGLNWPVNDLSRGCSVEDILDVAAATVIQAQAAAAGRRTHAPRAAPWTRQGEPTGSRDLAWDAPPAHE